MKFKVEIHTVHDYEIVVEADSEDDARQIAINAHERNGMLLDAVSDSVQVAAHEIEET